MNSSPPAVPPDRPRLPLLATANTLSVCTGTLGVAALVGWLLTGNGTFVGLGFFTLFLVLPAVTFVGLILVVIASRRQTPSKQTLISILLLGLNFPLGIACLVIGEREYTRYTVEIVNQSGQMLKSITVEGGGVRFDTGPIPHDSAWRQSMWFEADGELVAIASGTEHRHPLEDYVTGGIGGQATWTVTPNDLTPVP